nr:MAG TPA: hypothetical protein [Crassvirales sp.]DAU16045.1 MAG TPA: hypothetical protein [Caudoviricetes sp.]
MIFIVYNYYYHSGYSLVMTSINTTSNPSQDISQ